MKLYHYVHCPFCVRVRLALGYLGIQYESIVLPYNDEATPISLTGVKMLPILQKDDESAMNESLDIIKYLDASSKIYFDIYENFHDEVDLLLSRIGKEVHSLAMPYWIWTPEFTGDSRKYFQAKKELKRGPFAELVKNKHQFLLPLNEILNELEDKLVPFYRSNQISIVDIMIASHLWGMYIVPEFQFPPIIHQYLQSISKICYFNYHGDYWL